MNRYVYQYRTYYYDDVTIYLEYYAAPDADTVWRHVFGFMQLSRVNEHFKTNHPQHSSFSIHQVREYLKNAGNATVYRYEEPLFLPLHDPNTRSFHKSSISP